MSDQELYLGRCILSIFEKLENDESPRIERVVICRRSHPVQNFAQAGIGKLGIRLHGIARLLEPQSDVPLPFKLYIYIEV
jgi:hypothetical protein